MRIENGWVLDERNNRASVARWGTADNARAALDGLSGCHGCTDCSCCVNCSACIDCSDCSYCAGCSGCSGCSDCFVCSDCSVCSGCSGRCDCSGLSDRAALAVPAIQDIHGTLLAAVERPGHALDMCDWHTCETTHCRAGWVVHLAGAAGYALEAKTSPLFAALQIYKASGYAILPSRFFDPGEDALADMRRLAAVEAEAKRE